MFPMFVWLPMLGLEGGEEVDQVPPVERLDLGVKAR